MPAVAFPARQVIFGLADGSMSITGVVLYAAGHSGIVFSVACAGGLSAAASMAGGELLSDRKSSWLPVTSMGAATLLGSVIPALPYLFLHGWAAPAVAVVLLLGVAVVVARLRGHCAHPYRDTVAVLAAVLVLSAVFALAVPS